MASLPGAPALIVRRSSRGKGWIMELNLSFPQLRALIDGLPNKVAAAALPIMALAILAEMLVIQARGGRYPWQGSLVSVTIAIGHAIAQAIINGLILGVIAATVYQFRLFTIDVSFNNAPALVSLFLLADFAFYCEHRCAHRIRFLWASHSVHHSVDHMVFTAAFRLAWTPVLSGVFLFYLPIVWLGFAPQWVFGMASASLTYQFFIHTELAPRIGWLEWALNTPSAHRVHHACNKEYIDKNFGGVLLIWDHLFGTYQAERKDIDIIYGVLPARSKPANPLVIAYEELWDMARDVLRARSWRERWGRMFGPPGWTA
ncbi:Sterol desaturase/sphingolipid hydroxylase, fatty acid hydroxylase superfamily [Methylocella tundrae]|uniref:Sterol desaturase/sphingolipid hydroxylase, fatty acid hydroxylase superfamily n=2 Tax=Methylocella tundrae TaxID=227605 RepID=A0A8B6M4N5_METTU|nr:Sterol desaturase/sphingolipid hydroxylase, fatty acid hydroxylase superfamily [Methylocella tundrae]